MRYRNRQSPIGANHRLALPQEKPIFVSKFERMGVQTDPMCNLQFELLKLYATNLSEQQMLDIKRKLKVVKIDIGRGDFGGGVMLGNDLKNAYFCSKI